MKIKELSDIERLKLSLEYSISKEHKESLMKRLRIDNTKVDENKNDIENNNYKQIEQVGFL